MKIITVKLKFQEVFTVEITDIRIRQIAQEGKMKAVVSVTFDNAFVVHDIKIIEGTDKLFIAMPSRKTPENEYKDIAHPINMEMREILQQRIIDKYESTILQEELSAIDIVS
jgi:stage V sporulation protein G